MPLAEAPNEQRNAEEQQAEQRAQVEKPPRPAQWIVEAQYGNDGEVGDARQRDNKGEKLPKPIGVDLDWILSGGDASVGQRIGDFQALDGPKCERSLQDH